ncbi:MAG: lipoyl synthase [Candidatus Omnitrophota bacterium]|jgi:lipoic acid synthetase
MNSVPYWLKKRLTVNESFFDTKKVLAEFSVNTVCESARCPNLNECFSSKFATFMILGNACTRSCAFCSVKKEAPVAVDSGEPERIAACVKRLGIKHVIVTSVTRDDLADGGAGQFVRTVKAVEAVSGDAVIEVLIPDFGGDREAIAAVALSGADIIGHNIETISRLYPVVRKGADYARTLDILRSIKESGPGLRTKSAILLGLGESEEEAAGCIKDLRGAGCDILMIGQYLRPNPENHPVDRFVRPEEFERLRKFGMSIGFKQVSSGPFVRSSYVVGKGQKNDKCHTTTIS